MTRQVARFWTSISQCTNPHFFRNFLTAHKNSWTQVTENSTPFNFLPYIWRFFFYCKGEGPLWVRSERSRIFPPPTQGRPVRKKLGICTFRYERSKSGIFEPPPDTHRVKVRTPNTGLQSNLVIQKTLTPKRPFFPTSDHRWPNLGSMGVQWSLENAGFWKPRPQNTHPQIFFGRPKIFYVWPKI